MILKLASLLNAQVRVTQIIHEALEARSALDATAHVNIAEHGLLSLESAVTTFEEAFSKLPLLETAGYHAMGT